jgi:hypothetical protein
MWAETTVHVWRTKVGRGRDNGQPALDYLLLEHSVCHSVERHELNVKAL